MNIKTNVLELSKEILRLNRVFSLMFSFFLLGTLNAQITTPQSSPLSKIDQQVGLTDVTLEYSRPSMKGRVIFGDLVPYNKMWRSGANKNSVINFNTDVRIGGKDLRAGSYAIFITPSIDTWDIILYTDTNNWGIPKTFDETKVAAKVRVITKKSNYTSQTWTISFNTLTNSSAELGFNWENTYASLKFEVPTDATVTADIEKTMNGPSARDYYAAAVYYLQQNKDINKAKSWMDKAMTLTKEPAFWQYRQQSLLYAKLKDNKNAIIAAKKSLEGAKKADNQDYIKMNIDSLKEWGAH